MQGSSKSGRGRTVKRSRVAAFNDPRWLAMWYLVSLCSCCWLNTFPALSLVCNNNDGAGRMAFDVLIGL